MRVTFLGHAGMYVETEGGTVLCDPWFTPAHFGSWFPFPRNDGLEPARFSSPDYLYVSHLHRDHFDPAWLAAHVDKGAKVLLPAFELDHLERALRQLGFTEFVRTEHGKPVRLGKLDVAILAYTAPADGPVGDSVLVLADATARILNQNDARPRDLHELEALGPFDAHFTQFSGAIWYPMVYDFPAEEKLRIGIGKRADQMERARHYLRDLRAPHLFPVAGPPCFLDDDLFALNDLDGDPSNIFPDQLVFLEELERAGLPGGQLLVPGSVAMLVDGSCRVEQPTGDAAPDAIFRDKRATLGRYRDDWRDWLLREHASWPSARTDVVGALAAWWEPLLDIAPLTRAGVGAPVLLHVGDVGVLIDFPAGRVREWKGEAVSCRIDTERALVESCIERRVEDWVSELFLSCRFRAHRHGAYNEYLYTFFKCLSVERMVYCEGHYATRSERGDETFRAGDYLIQKRCPHLRADLERFGQVEGGTLKCMVHHWRFELETGRCLTSDDDEHRLRTVRIRT